MDHASEHRRGDFERDPYEGPTRSGATHHAGQWGLAALLLSCFLLLLFPVMLIAEFLGAVVGVLALGVDDNALRGYASLVSSAIYVFIGTAILALVFGIIGLASALFRRQPAGLAVAGSILAVIALVLQILLLVITFRLADDMLREKPLWRQQQMGPLPARPGQFP